MGFVSSWHLALMGIKFGFFFFPNKLFIPNCFLTQAYLHLELLINDTVMTIKMTTSVMRMRMMVVDMELLD